MSGFKVGDRVRFVTTRYAGEGRAGQGTITAANATRKGHMVKPDNFPSPLYYRDHELTFPEPTSKFKVGDKAVIATDYWDSSGRVSPFRRGAVVEVVGVDETRQCYPYTVKPLDGTPTQVVARENELAPYVERKPESKYAKGDKVRVSFEGTVSAVYDGDEVQVTDDKRNVAFVRDVSVVEKIVPPVETFKPGDYVRSKAIPDYTYLILKRGYVDLYNKHAVRAPDVFTSKYYDRFELVEKPF